MKPDKCTECGEDAVISTDTPNVFRCTKCNGLYTITDKGLVKI